MDVQIGARLRALRERKGLTQVELAALVGLHQAYIANLENDVKTPSLGTLVALARALDATPDSFLHDVPVTVP